MLLQASAEMIHLDAAEIGVITALLAALAGSVTFVFRQLLMSKSETIRLYEHEIGALRHRLDQALADRTEVEHQLVGAFSSALRENTKAMNEVVHELRELSKAMKAQQGLTSA